MNQFPGIFQYDINTICAYISYKTGTNFSYVRQKKQIKYIDNYLTELTKESNLCFVYEDEYIDKNYLDDYSSYYVNCFISYSKIASRIHFFQYTDDSKDENFLKNQISSALNNEESILNNNNYLGFIVIRPIPKTFFGRICLKPFYSSSNRYKKYYLFKEYKVSLFGIALTVNSVAFQEQDKILSACATTALWTFYQAHQNIPQITFPSSSEITKSAYSELNGYSREFPNTGLSTKMICRSLKYYNLSPESFVLSDMSKKQVKEMIYAYCSSGIPIILGVSVRDEDNKEKGLHAITVLGYSIENADKKFVAHGLKKIYAHDDRYGPFIRMQYEKNYFHVELDSDMNLDEETKNEKYKIDSLILGLYHKIRIPYLPIKTTCIALLKILLEYLSDVKLSNNSFEMYSKLISSICWDISIVENNSIKKDLLKKDIDNKERILTTMWPKYLWQASALVNGETVFQLIFDARDIDHGDVFLEYISYSLEGLDIYNVLMKYSKIKIENDIYNFNSLEEKEENFLNGVFKYFNKEVTYQDCLDKTFGYLQIPIVINGEEINDYKIINSKKERANFRCTYGFQLDKNLLDSNCRYIWLIDIEGFLCIGIEEIGTKSNGHPTLTNGMPARVGGELSYCTKNNYWMVNTKSRRYSSKYEKDELRKYLINAIDLKFKILFPTERFEYNKDFFK